MMVDFSPLHAHTAFSVVIKSLAVTAMVLMCVHAQAQDDKKPDNKDDKKAGADAQALPKTLSAKELLARGNEFNSKGDLDRAIADYDVALKIDPILVEALNSRAMAWRAKGDRRKALADLDAALKFKPDFEVARANRKTLFHEIERAGAHMPLKPPAASN